MRKYECKYGWQRRVLRTEFRRTTPRNSGGANLISYAQPRNWPQNFVRGRLLHDIRPNRCNPPAPRSPCLSRFMGVHVATKFRARGLMSPTAAIRIYTRIYWSVPVIPPYLTSPPSQPAAVVVATGWPLCGACRSRPPSRPTADASRVAAPPGTASAARRRTRASWLASRWPPRADW